MKRLLSFLVFISLSSLAFSQNMTPVASWGFDWPRGGFDSVLYLPTGCGAPSGIASLRYRWLRGSDTVDGQILRMAALMFDSCGHKWYGFDPTDSTWSLLGSGGGGSGGSADSIRKIQVDTTGMGSNGGYMYYDIASGKYKFRIITLSDVLTALGYAPLAPTDTAGKWLGKLNNLNDIPNPAIARTNLSLGTSATRNVAAFGDAATSEVVKGDDTRLTNSRFPNGSAGGDLTGTYPAPTIATNAVTNTKGAQMPANTVKGNNTGSTANAADLTVAQVNALIGNDTSRAMIGGLLAQKQNNYGGAPGQLQGTYAGIPAATGYATGTTYIAQDSGFQYVDTGSGGSRGWKRVGGGSSGGGPSLTAVGGGDTTVSGNIEHGGMLTKDPTTNLNGHFFSYTMPAGGGLARLFPSPAKGDKNLTYVEYHPSLSGPSVNYDTSHNEPFVVGFNPYGLIDPGLPGIYTSREPYYRPLLSRGRYLEYHDPEVYTVDGNTTRLTSFTTILSLDDRTISESQTDNRASKFNLMDLSSNQIFQFNMGAGDGELLHYKNQTVDGANTRFGWTGTEYDISDFGGGSHTFGIQGYTAINIGVPITNIGHVFPATDNAWDLGAIGQVWRKIYSGTGWFATAQFGGSQTVVPNAYAHFAPGTTTVPAIVFDLPSAVLTTTPIQGALEAADTVLTYTDGFSVRDTLLTKRQARLEFAAISAGGASTGSYVPVITNGSNVTSSVADSAHWDVVSNTVHVAGSVDVTVISASVSTQIKIALPINSNIGGSSAWGWGSSLGVPGIITYTSGTNVITLTFITNAGSAGGVFHFTYGYTYKIY